MTDDDLRTKWRDAGGSFYGPNVETGTMPESKLLPFLRSLMPDGIVYTTAAQDVLEQWFADLGLDMPVDEVKELFDKMTEASKT